jgi:hypothetical protein
MTPQKQLPIGISSLEEIINSNLLYIDKTEIVHRLITTNRRCFFSRPRRFGKSLLISTLKEIFLGNKKLFKDLWIGQGDRYTWQQRPVIHIDFSQLNTDTLDTLKNDLNNTLDTVAIHHGCNASHRPFPREKIAYLCETIGAQTKIAILIDEYDAPLLRHITNTEMALPILDFLSGFYTTIKALDAYIHFTFVTGVTKFAKTSLFSGPNNLDDLSLSEKFATLCGYTEKEILANCTDYIIECAVAQQTNTKVIIQGMRRWYNGYQMSDYLIEKVYNPFSVLLYLKHQKLGVYFNYAQPSPQGYGGQPSLYQKNSFAGLPAEALCEGWFSTGTPTFLVKLIQNNIYNFTNIDHSKVSGADLETFDLSAQDHQGNYKQLPLPMLMLQTGYLTIESYTEKGSSYILAYPNQEIRESLNQLVLCSTLVVDNSTINDAKEKILHALQTNNIGLFCTIIQSLLAHIPYHIHVKEEAFYHAILHMICVLLQINTESEVAVAGGRADMIIQTKSALYLFECKLNASPEIALEQIQTKRYYEKYYTQHKPVYLVGLNFDYATKTMTHVVEKAPQ